MRFPRAAANARPLCSREESNLHGFPHTVLSRTRLPFRHVSAEMVDMILAPGFVKARWRPALPTAKLKTLKGLKSYIGRGTEFPRQVRQPDGLAEASAFGPMAELRK